jgi:hypothetical protein
MPYAQYWRALRSIFDDTYAGRLVEASRSLLEISEWLVINAQDLGMTESFFMIFRSLPCWMYYRCCRSTGR